MQKLEDNRNKYVFLNKKGPVSPSGITKYFK